MARRSANLHRRVLARIVASPSVLLPMVGGATLALGAWASGHLASIPGFAGVLGVFFGVGMLATRWFGGLEREVERVLADDAEAARREEDRSLDELEKRLRADRDPRTGQMLRSLRELRAGLHRDLDEGGAVPTAVAVDVRSLADRLFASCVASLERSLELFRAARSLRTREARQSLLEERDHVLGDVATTIDHLAAVADELRSRRLRGDEDDGRLATLRRELGDSLEVARRVEARLRGLDAGTRPERERE